jgi:hypothetical protein
MGLSIKLKLIPALFSFKLRALIHTKLNKLCSNVHKTVKYYIYVIYIYIYRLTKSRIEL